MAITPCKGLSQVFLVNEQYLKKIAAFIQPAGCMLEIGPGRGELTKYLLEKTSRLLLVEIDQRLVSFLNKKYASAGHVQLIASDILAVPLDEYATEKDMISIVGNLPYHLSFKLIEYFVRYRTLVSAIHATFQKEFAQKLAARPGTKNYCFMTCFFQYYFKITGQVTIPASAFSPQPKIDSQFIKIDRAIKGDLTEQQETFMFKMIRQAFLYRRKKITNALGSFDTPGRVDDALKEASINTADRPDAISLEQYTALAKHLQKT